MKHKTKNSLDPFPTTNIKVFNYNIAQVKISQNKTVKSIEVNGDIPAKILAISSEKGTAIDFEMTLQYPLSPIPLYLCNGNEK